MNNIVSIEQLDRIKNYYIISQQRSGSTLLASMLNNHNEVTVVIEENTFYLLKGKYKDVLFDTNEKIDLFIDDFYFLIYLKINALNLPPKNELKTNLKKYKNQKLNYKQFINLFYLQFYSFLNLKKDVKYVINKEVNYHHILDRFYNDNTDTKFIFLIRNCLSNSGKFIRGTNKNKVVSEALSWKLRTRYFVNPRIPKDTYKIILFEDLITDREKILMQVCQFFDIPFQSGMLNFQEHIDDNLKKNSEIHSLHPDFLDFFNKMHGSTFSKTQVTNRIKELELTKRQQAKTNLICYKERKFFGYPVMKIRWNHYFYFTPFDLFLIIKTYFFNSLSNIYFKLSAQNRYFLRSINKNYWLINTIHMMLLIIYLI